jgi:DNA-binding MarR family transcriptional regulator
MEEKKKNFINLLINDFYNAAGKYASLVNSQIPVPLFKGLSIKDSHILVFIGRNPTINITELSAKFAVTKGAMSKNISRLESRHFLTKTLADMSSREVKLSLTPKGSHVFDIFEAKAEVYRLRLYELLDEVTLSHLMSTALFMEEFNKLMDDYGNFINDLEKGQQGIENLEAPNDTKDK